jgi:hypothetical protein
MAGKRKAISKKLRFDVFKRDEFECQYCGAHPPSVILHVDHIHPVIEGGDNSIDNLITSCESCNLGKGRGLLTDVPEGIKDKAKKIAESELQMKGYMDIVAAKRDRIDAEAWKVAAALDGVDYVKTYNTVQLMSIKRFLEKLNYFDVLDAANIAFSKFYYPTNKRFKYFCGICWNKLKAE